MWGPSTPNPTRVSWKPLILKKWPIVSVCMWICGGLAPCGPKCTFGDQKRPHSEKRSMSFGHPSHHRTRNCGLCKNINFPYFLPFMGQNGVFWVQKWCFRVFWTGCEVADLKQRQRITTMDHINKIQSLVLPTDDPGDAPNCMCEYGPVPVNTAACAIQHQPLRSMGFPSHSSCI